MTNLRSVTGLKRQTPKNRITEDEPRTPQPQARGKESSLAIRRKRGREMMAIWGWKLAGRAYTHHRLQREGERGEGKEKKNKGINYWYTCQTTWWGGFKDSWLSTYDVLKVQQNLIQKHTTSRTGTGLNALQPIKPTDLRKQPKDILSTINTSKIQLELSQGINILSCKDIPGH